MFIRTSLSNGNNLCFAHIGCINLTPPSVYNVAKGPTKSPIKISGKIAGILNFQATHCANIPQMMIPANSNIYVFFRENNTF